MAGFDPKAYGIDSRLDTGLFLFVGGLAGMAEAVFGFADSNPLTLGAMARGVAVGARRLFTKSESVDRVDPPSRERPSRTDTE